MNTVVWTLIGAGIGWIIGQLLLMPPRRKRLTKKQRAEWDQLNRSMHPLDSTFDTTLRTAWRP